MKPRLVVCLAMVALMSANADEPSFRRQVVPLLSRAGCSGRECHGSFAGRGGFQLSLFGYDFEADHRELTQDADGDEGAVRVKGDQPAKSLLLLKPTAQVNHKGKERIKKDSWEYNLLLQWIAGGAKNDAEKTGEFDRLEIFPADIVFRNPGEQVQLKVLAHWKDGAVEDVTQLTRFRSNDDSLATISDTGLVECKEKGDTHVIAFYDNGILPVPVLLPASELTGSKYPNVPTPTRVDELIVGKLRKLGIVPSEPCTDAEFFRRASLDIAGTLPAAYAVTKFLADRSPEKRAKKIDELLNSPGHAAWWTTKLCDFTGNSARQIFSDGIPDLNGEYARQWWDWIQRRIEKNEPYNKLVAGIVLSASRSSPEQSYKDYALEMISYLRREHRVDFAQRATMPHFWARKNVQKPEDRALAFAHAFLGMRIECAECHKHPFDQWTKTDYVQFQAFFEPVRYDSNIRRDDDVNFATVTKELRAAVGGGTDQRAKNAQAEEARRRIEAGEMIPIHEVYVSTNARAKKAAREGVNYSGRVLTPKLLGGEAVLLSEYADPREPLMQWLRSKDNPFFARAFVNRVWAGYFHAGLIDPPDDMNLANPPANAAVLDYLAGAFITHGYDMKWLHREIVSSDTYQRSWRPNATNRLDERNFSRFVPRRLPAEVLLDALTLATAASDRQQTFATDIIHREIGPNVAAFGLIVPGGDRNDASYALTAFGKPARETNCDCERTTIPTLLQTLYVRNDPELLARIESRRDETPAWISELRKTPRHFDGGRLATEVFLRTVSRLPSVEELQKARSDIAAAKDPIDGVRDLLWALLNTREFQVNH